MAFNPSSTIYLCNVPIDSTYKNQIYFTSAAQQYAYFAGKAVKRLENYTTVREKLPNGGFQSKVRVGINIDDLYQCNYMFYQNANHGSRFFYAFIDKLIYINEGITEIVFETDVFQTWLFDVKLLDSYVVREHIETDTIGANTVPEKFEATDFKYVKMLDLLADNSWGYLVGSANALAANGAVKRGYKMNGIYQGLYFYLFTNVEALNTFISTIENEHADCIQFITLIPAFNMGGSSWLTGGLLGESNSPANYEATVMDVWGYAQSKGYNPKNKKLLTFPYTSLVITNHAGEEAEYKIEDFSTAPKVAFNVYGDISAFPSVTAIPENYKGLENAFEQGISVSGFPQCSFNNDTFKLWLAKNQFGAGLSIAQGAASVGAGIGATLSGNPLGLAMVGNGVSNILNTINSGYQASKEPNKVNSGNSKANLLTALKQNTLTLQLRHIKKGYMQTLDDFFTMYGYQTNRVKKPNVSSRPYFNYVQTVDVNITGGIPADDMEKLKAMYNNGVTFWKPNATVGNYAVNNSP